MSTDEEGDDSQEERIQKLVAQEYISSLIHNNYTINNKITIPYLFDPPEKTIEKILINIFNHNISPETNDDSQLDILDCKTKVKVLCTKYDKYIIAYILLKKIQLLIKKYKKKLFELPEFSMLSLYLFQNHYNTSKILPIIKISKFPKTEFPKYKLRKKRIKSMPKYKNQSQNIPNYFTIMEKIFSEIKSIKNCLAKSASSIENIFQPVLSDFEKFSIDDCEKEEFYKVIIKDQFIWQEIIKNRKTRLNYLIKELELSEYKYINIMKEKLNYFMSIYTSKKYELNEIKICEIGSSIDDRNAEDSVIVTGKPSSMIDKKTKADNKNNIIIKINENNENGIKKDEIIKNEVGKNKDEQNDIEKNKIEMNVNIKTVYKIKKKNNDMHIINTKIEDEKKPEKNSLSLNGIVKNAKEKDNKKDVPSDIDDLVKYIANNDDKKENIQSTNTKRKKKKNKKTKKRKNEEEEDEKNINESEEINKIKEDLIKHSINKFKINKIKFKYQPEWLEKITKNQFD